MKTYHRAIMKGGVYTVRKDSPVYCYSLANSIRAFAEEKYLRTRGIRLVRKIK